MKDFLGWDDQTILTELGARLRQQRLNMDMTQQELAERAGLSTRTVRSMEAGENPRLQTLIRVLRALGMIDRLDSLVPEVGPSPLQLLEMSGRRRRRASGRRS